MGFFPYELVYGKNAIFPIEFEVKTLKTTTTLNLNLTNAQTSPAYNRLMSLMRNGWQPYSKHLCYSNRGPSGMTELLRRSYSTREIGPYCMTLGSPNLKVNYALGGSDPMKSTLSFLMG